MKRDFEYHLLKVRESIREELELKYKMDIKTHDELIELFKAEVFEGSLELHSGEHTVSRHKWAGIAQLRRRVK